MSRIELWFFGHAVRSLVTVPINLRTWSKWELWGGVSSTELWLFISRKCGHNFSGQFGIGVKTNFSEFWSLQSRNRCSWQCREMTVYAVTETRVRFASRIQSHGRKRCNKRAWICHSCLNTGQKTILIKAFFESCYHPSFQTPTLSS
jgi:hypothetical protein